MGTVPGLCTLLWIGQSQVTCTEVWAAVGARWFEGVRALTHMRPCAYACTQTHTLGIPYIQGSRTREQHTQVLSTHTNVACVSRPDDHHATLLWKIASCKTLTV